MGENQLLSQTPCCLIVLMRIIKVFKNRGINEKKMFSTGVFENLRYRTAFLEPGFELHIVSQDRSLLKIRKPWPYPDLVNQSV